MYVIQVLFDLYKLVSIELHHQTDYESKEHNHDFFHRCPTCMTGYLMRSEYQTMIDCVRESLPLKQNKTSQFVQLHRDPLRHEMLTDTGNITFVEKCFV